MKRLVVASLFLVVPISVAKLCAQAPAAAAKSATTSATSTPTPWENPLKKQLREGKPVIGMTVTVNNADVVLQAARIGFDFVWIEMEHSPITLETVRHMVLATQGTPLVPIVRVPVNELWTAKRALDAGALGVIFPFTSTPELAQQAVAACRYPPIGRRGAGAGLASLRWPAPQGYADFADKNALVIIIIEEKRAVDSIDAILDVPGIDVVFIGPNDLSYSYGDRGRQTPQVTAAIAKIVASAQKHGIPVGRTTGQNDVKGHIQQGFQFFQASSELGFLAAGARPLLEAAGKSAPDLKNRPLY
jgi:2-keto-3-deoxy-L-rhamnonate aldolase RhmA